MTTPTDDQPDPGPGGSIPLGDAARALLGVVQDWAQRTLPEPASGHLGPECQWCPLCQFASILRGEQPDVAERVAEAGTALVGALRSFLDSAGSHTPAGGEVRRPRPGKPRPSPRVQHIRLDDSGLHSDLGRDFGNDFGNDIGSDFHDDDTHEKG